MDKHGSQKPYIRFHTPEQLQCYLERAGTAEISFRAYPTSGEPETYNYSSREKAVSRESDGRSFDSLDDFTCYAFQCDIEGYANTEYVDLEVLN
ncbi:MAG: hypothetical protein PHT62_08790 [Desulfotomaculaceae bacterium]|nr:hypothetical protein [Desulfotomaculaceae bacterium]